MAVLYNILVIGKELRVGKNWKAGAGYGECSGKCVGSYIANRTRVEILPTRKKGWVSIHISTAHISKRQRERGKLGKQSGVHLQKKVPWLPSPQCYINTRNNIAHRYYTCRGDMLPTCLYTVHVCGKSNSDLTDIFSTYIRILYMRVGK